MIVPLAIIIFAAIGYYLYKQGYHFYGIMQLVLVAWMANSYIIEQIPCRSSALDCGGAALIQIYHDLDCMDTPSIDCLFTMIKLGSYMWLIVFLAIMDVMLLSGYY